MAARQIGDEIDHEAAHASDTPVSPVRNLPAGQRWVRVRRGDHVEREFQALGFLGVDGKADAIGFRELREFDHPRRQFGQHPRTLGVFVARMQRRQLDRDRRRGEDIVAAPVASGLALRCDMLADGVDGLR